ncbi:MAG: thermonuclease family protein [Minisyncoccales bacterium]
MGRRISPIIYILVLIIVLVLGILIGQSSNKQPINFNQETRSNNINEETSFNGDQKNEIMSTSSPINSIQSVKVIRVLDGDTIEIEDGQRVRYLGINAPESGQPFSTEATRENERLVAGRTVNLEFDVQTQDRYQRLLAYVWVGNKLINEEIVRNGYAVSETIQPNVKYQDLILKAEQEARTACRGLWAGLCSQNQDQESSCIKIVNINADAPGNDNENKNGEWIEIKNSCVQAIPLKGWLLKDSSASNKYEFKDFTLEGSKSVIIYSGCGPDTSDKLYWQCPEGRYAIWNNTGDHAFLYDLNGNLVSDYQY